MMNDICSNSFISAFSLKNNLKQLFIRSKDNVAPVDGFRALAILFVIGAHTLIFTQYFIANASEQIEKYPIWIRWLLQGDLGVDIFFVISGFLIGSILLQEYQKHQDIKLKRFFMRRFLRLMPVYWFALGLGVLASHGSPSRQFGAITFNSNVEYVWANLLYVNNFLDPSNQFLAHTWSLAVEEQFYIIFPFLLLAFFKYKLYKHPLKTLAGIIGLYLAIRLVVSVYAINSMMNQCGVAFAQIFELTSFNFAESKQNYCMFAIYVGVVYDNLYTRYIALFAGVLAAYFHIYKEAELKKFFSQERKINFLALIALFLFCFAFVESIILTNPELASLYWVIYQLFFSAAVTYLLLFCLYGTGVFAYFSNRLLSARMLYPIARVSYAAYLFHVFVITAVYKSIASQTPDMTVTEMLLKGAPVALLLTLFISTMTYLFIEKPFMNIRKPVS